MEMTRAILIAVALACFAEGSLATGQRRGWTRTISTLEKPSMPTTKPIPHRCRSQQRSDRAKTKVTHRAASSGDLRKWAERGPELVIHIPARPAPKPKR